MSDSEMSDGGSELRSLARGVQKLKLRENRILEDEGTTLNLKDTKRMRFGYPAKNPQEYLTAKQYKDKGEKVTRENIKEHAIIVKLEDKPGASYFPANTIDKYIPGKNNSEKYRNARALRNELGLPPKEAMELKRNVNKADPSWKDKNGKQQPKYKLSGEQMYFETAEGTRMREYSYSPEHKPASGEWASDVMAERHDGSTATYSFAKGDPIKSHKELEAHLSSETSNVSEVYYRSYAGNKFMSKTEMDTKGISTQQFINEFRNEHPGPEVALKVDNEMYPAEMINENKEEAAELHEYLHGKREPDHVVEVMVKGRNGELAQAQFVEADEPKHFKKIMEKHGIDPNNFAKMNGRNGVDQRYTTNEKDEKKEIGMKAVAVRSSKTDNLDDKETIWFHDRKSGTWRGATDATADLRSRIANKEVSKSDILVVRQEMKRVNGVNREEGALNGHMKSLSEIHPDHVPSKAAEKLAALGLKGYESSRSMSEKAYLTPEPSPIKETFKRPPASQLYGDRQPQSGVDR